jgi:hypothetical protein
MKKTSVKKGGFFWDRQLYQSPAFLDLHKNGIIMLIALMDARKREFQSQAKDKKGNRRKPEFINLDCLEMPYLTLKKVYGMNQHGIVRAIDKLLANGFIKIPHYGGLGEHDRTRYALIDDYLKWEPGTVLRKRTRDIRIGYQKKYLGVTKKGSEKKVASQNDTLIRVPKRHPSENSQCRNDTLPKPPFSPVSIGE